MYPWEMKSPPNVRHIEHLAPTDHSVLYSSSRATLNITRKDMAAFGYCPSGRFFEAAACGTPIISDWFEGLDSFFTPDEQIVIAREARDVVHALRRPAEELASIALRARE